MPSPLDGITVLDLTIWQNGPWATVMLSDMGANVIKVEDPVNGDPGRASAHRVANPKAISLYFETMNRNKRSMTLNLKSDEGREVFYRMAAKADVVIQNFRVGVVERLGVDYETIRKINPRIVYASASGLGDQGPHARDGVFDILGQARGGFMWANAMPDEDVQYRLYAGIADQTGAIMLAYGVMAGIVARERLGVGQHMQTSQLAAQLTLQALALNGHLLLGSFPRTTSRRNATNPLWNTYKCSDGQWVVIGCIQSDRYWPEFCRGIGAEHLIADPRCVNQAERVKHCTAIIEMLDKIFVTKSRAEWIEILKARGVIVGPVQAYHDIPNDPQVIANEYVATLHSPVYGDMREVGVPVKLSETPAYPRKPAPQFGEHTEEVLQEFGYTWDELAGLRERHVI
ncbi:MAG: CoA transferase [Chloroflexi bacterium]|nr:CoA transferase [Chloroflexota bacterium]